MSGGNYDSSQLTLFRMRALAGLLVLLVLAVSFASVARPLLAQGDAAAISQGFETADTIDSGALVSNHPDNPSSIELANIDRVADLVGVAGERALIELSGQDKQVQVVTSGTVNALVSNINGDIKNGDKITASPINGVGMRTEGGVQVVGTAQADFSAVQTTEQEIKDRSGKSQFIRAGLLPIQVNVTYFAEPDKPTTLLPGFLQEIANTVAGRDVSPIRVLVSTFALLLGFVSMAVLLYASVRSSIISIGRNPLSEKAVRKSLFGVALTGIGILLLTLIAIYLILRI